MQTHATNTGYKVILCSMTLMMNFPLAQAVVPSFWKQIASWEVTMETGCPLIN